MYIYISRFRYQVVSLDSTSWSGGVVECGVVYRGTGIWEEGLYEGPHQLNSLPKLCAYTGM